MGLADLHMYTIYSYDASSSVPAILERAQHVSEISPRNGDK